MRGGHEGSGRASPRSPLSGDAAFCWHRKEKSSAQLTSAKCAEESLSMVQKGGGGGGGGGNGLGSSSPPALMHSRVAKRNSAAQALSSIVLCTTPKDDEQIFANEGSAARSYRESPAHEVKTLPHAAVRLDSVGVGGGAVVQADLPDTVAFQGAMARAPQGTATSSSLGCAVQGFGSQMQMAGPQWQPCPLQFSE
eukprot:CAMPEP_0174351454 /NCGR_PEP_ID=MMETSP0811_2-20130205/8826_1 /TAXON_ID=73025 ORGANISM="Eutreptiella gymnastica-like, Strain CCMP1594" /NCGR_SAMPLE_ID=MMETSP0811_2 /ASSEMBLY_ACC=CAM_ASM_000667 /LENGTH=194 /DNA_ID=CAMNT_0015480707 /DNA_START=1496 /DNA_END=2081 /DNA_ORIENTATION=-